MFFLFSGHGHLVHHSTKIEKKTSFDVKFSRTFSDQKKNVPAVSFEIQAACQTLTM